LLNTQALFYTGKLWLVEGDVTLDRARFEVLEGQATLVVTGAVQLDLSLDPSILATRLHQVHNLGEITGTTPQLAALQARVGLNEGEWNDSSSPQEESSTDEGVIGDIAYLKL
jgi:hypothetical protein